MLTFICSRCSRIIGLYLMVQMLGKWGCSCSMRRCLPFPYLNVSNGLVHRISDVVIVFHGISVTKSRLLKTNPRRSEIIGTLFLCCCKKKLLLRKKEYLKKKSLFCLWIVKFLSLVLYMSVLNFLFLGPTTC